LTKYQQLCRGRLLPSRASPREQAPDIDPAELTVEEAVALIEAERRRQMIRNAIGPPSDR
jgi:hypothetical protein